MKFLCLFILLLVTPIYSVIINIPQDYDNIQAGINASTESDTIIVQSGTYYENIDFNGKNIVLSSEFLLTGNFEQVETTIINGSQSGSVVTIANNETTNAELCGLTITNGLNGIGSGIRIENSNPQIHNNIIEENYSPQYCGGGGISLSNSASEIKENIIRANHGALFGSGIYISDSQNTIVKNNMIYDHLTDSGYGVASGAGIFVENSQNILIKNNLLYANNVDFGSGDMISTDNSSVLIENCTFYNTSSSGISLSLSSDSEIVNSIIWKDGEFYGNAFNNNNPNASYSLVHEEIEGNNIIYQNPDFNNLEDFSLNLQSPCINRGDPSSQNDPDSTRNDIGWKYFDLSDYGTISGQVTLEDGIGEMSNVLISTNEASCQPIQSGDYMIHLLPGTYDLTAGLGLHYYQTIEDIELNQNQEITNMDFYLENITNNITIEVDQNGNYDFDTIQAAIDIAVEGDTILIHDGIYEEDLHIFEKQIVLGSLLLTDNDSSHIQNTIIQGNNHRLLTIENIPDTSFTINGLTFRNGHGYNGGAIYVRHSNPVFDKCVIDDNSAENQGGGVYNYHSNSVFRNCNITNNESPGGGGVANEYSDSEFHQCRITNNTAYSGGGIHNYYSSVIIKESLISENTATNGNGGGIDNLYESEIYLANNVINSNLAVLGGGLYFKGGAEGSVINNLFFANNASTAGGAIRCRWASPTILNNTLVANEAGSSGGGLDFYDRSDPDLYNNIIWDNSAPNGNQIAITSSYADPNFYNCDIQNGFDGFYFENEDDYQGIFENNIDQDPDFISNTDFNLRENSPCIDSGTMAFPDSILMPEVDLNNNPRIFGDNIDIGAYEWNDTGIPNGEFSNKKYQIYNYPNPFGSTKDGNHASTNIIFNLPENSKVKLNIYNIKGQKVITLTEKPYSQGTHSLTWKGENSAGNTVTSGIYFYQLSINNKKKIIKKCLLLK